MRPALAGALTAAVVVGFSPGARAQESRPRPARPPVANQFEITTQIAEALRYLSNDPERALFILRDLDARFPSDERVLSRIGYTMQVMGKSDSAIVYYRRSLRENPAGLDAGKSLGTLYLSSGNDAAAKEVFAKLLEASDHNLSAYKTVGDALTEQGRHDAALELYEGGRKRGDRYNALTLDIAKTQTLLGNLDRAMDEYLFFLTQQGRNYRFARDRMLETLRGAGREQGHVVAYLEQKLKTGDPNRYAILDVLSAWYLEKGLLEKSLDAALSADREKESDGSVLLSLADQIIVRSATVARAEKMRYLQLGIRALDGFTRNHDRAPGTDRARYMLARIYAEFGVGRIPNQPRAESISYLERAVAEYEDLSRRFPNSEFAERAYLERGDILLRSLKRPPDALAAYKSGAVNARHIGNVFATRIAELYLGTSDYDNAAHYISSLMRAGAPELVQTGYYYTGVMSAFRGEFPVARDTLTALAEANPASQFANDAIAMAWVIEEALQYQSKSLAAYMGAQQADMVGDTAAVLTHLATIAEQPVYETLRPRALFWLGREQYGTGDLNGALATFRRFLSEYPDEGLRPDVQRQLAAVYENGFEQYDRALREYEMVLVEYPGYAFLDDIRKDVRRLRDIVKGEPDEN